MALRVSFTDFLNPKYEYIQIGRVIASTRDISCVAAEGLEGNEKKLFWSN
jgi:RNA-binding protein YlmH